MLLHLVWCHIHLQHLFLDPHASKQLITLISSFCCAWFKWPLMLSFNLGFQFKILLIIYSILDFFALKTYTRWFATNALKFVEWDFFGFASIVLSVSECADFAALCEHSMPSHDHSNRPSYWATNQGVPYEHLINKSVRTRTWLEQFNVCVILSHLYGNVLF